jgi:hypothetical protein
VAIPLSGVLSALLSCCLFLVGAAVAETPPPDWVVQRPVSADYYYGIGVAAKDTSGTTAGEHLRAAEQNALSNLAAQISVTVSGELIDRVLEKSGLVERDFESFVKATTEAELSGHELVDTWKNDTEYWVLYRLSKALHERQRREKRETALALGLDLFAKAKESERGRAIADALLFHLQALQPLQPYLGETLRVEYEGCSIQLGNEIYAALTDLLRGLELVPEKADLEVTLGRDTETPLALTAVYRDEGGERTPQRGLPIRFGFREGAGELTEEARTDGDGVARTLVTKVSSPEESQTVTARLDLSRMIPEEGRSVVIEATIASLPVPTTEFLLSVGGLAVHLTAEESGISAGGKFPRIEPNLRQALGKYGFVFVEDEADADLLLELRANAREGERVATKPRIVESVLVDVTVAVRDAATGKQLYEGEYTDIEGFGETNVEACHLAYVNAGRLARKRIVREIVARLQR